MVPKMPIGTEMMKTRRHSIGPSRPPRMSPMNDPAMAAIWLMPTAMPRSCGGNASVKMAVELAIRNAAPTPWKSRMITSQSPAAVPVIHVIDSISEKNV